MMRNLLFLLVFVFSAMQVRAQQNTGRAQQTQTTQAIVHVDQFLSGMRTSNTSRNGNDKLRVESLISDMQPSSYLENGSVKTYGDNPVCLFTDVRSFASIAKAQLPKSDIEIITVRIKDRSELSAALDFSVLSSFPKLQYVYLMAETTVAGRELVQMVRNNDPKLGVFYNFATTK